MGFVGCGEFSVSWSIVSFHQMIKYRYLEAYLSNQSL